MGDNHNRVEVDVVIRNSQGLHARPVMRFVDLASQYKANVRVQKGSTCVDGKSPMEMMLLEATAGTQLRLVGEGEDAGAAIAALIRLIEDKFHEE